mmetsp:Transcript_4891/g.11706  ORF Transcript_4891/g.11706 Transcript_4891/m.11706 type:complete len:299 (+) Transcript_4891:218-1114(+)
MGDEEAAAAAGTTFIKKARRGNIRKKSKEEKEEDEGGDEDARRVLEETRKEQQYRSRGSGVGTDALMAAGRAKRGPVVPEGDGDEVESSLLDSQFSSENAGTANLTVMEQHMMDYIDKKMSKDKPDESVQRAMTAEDELYVVPDSMKIGKKDEEGVENSAESWLTGIVEVELSMEEKLKNIEQTEAAKHQMLDNLRKGLTSSAFRVDTSTERGYARMDQREKKKGGRKGQAKVLTDEDKKLLSLPASTNFGANFHLKSVVVPNATPAAAPAVPGAAPKRNEMSSDDVVMEKFKKRFRR